MTDICEVQAPGTNALGKASCMVMLQANPDALHSSTHSLPHKKRRTDEMSPSDSLFVLSEEEVGKLAKAAIEAKARAYCRYSNFRVGAAVLLATGQIGTGANVEVASTPVGICAERCAIAPIVASIKRPDMPVIRAIAVSTDIMPPASPCGMCRQFIREFATSDSLPIYMYGSAGEEKVVVKTIGELLPMSFGPNDLERNKPSDGL